MIHVNVWQKPLQYCKIISLQLIKKKKRNTLLLRILSWQIFLLLFQYLKVSARLSSHLHCFQQSDVILIFVLFPLMYSAPSTTKIFITVWIVSLCVDVYVFLVLRLYWTLWICMFWFWSNLEKFWPLFLQKLFSVLLSFQICNCNM